MFDSLHHLPAFDSKDQTLQVIIETVQGKRNKLAYDLKLNLFKLKGVLPLGSAFPFDFGFIPSTLGEDGDPLDVLILMDEATFPGCLVPSRLLGVICAKQTEKGETEKNDRLIAVADNSRNHQSLKNLKEISGNILEEIEHFFISYNAIKGRKFTPTGRFGPARALRLVKTGMKCWEEKNK
jgi:inorganic pyrophosphatase